MLGCHSNSNDKLLSKKVKSTTPSGPSRVPTWTFASLPIEVVLRILKYISPSDEVCRLRLVSSSLNHAINILPSCTASQLIHKVFEGDIDAPFQTIFTTDDDVVLTHLRDTFRSTEFSIFQRNNPHNHVLCARYGLLIAIWKETHDFDDYVRVSTDIHALQRSILDRLDKGKKSHIPCLSNAPLHMFDFITSSMGSSERIRFSCEGGYIEHAYFYLERMCDDFAVNNWRQLDVIRNMLSSVNPSWLCEFLFLCPFTVDDFRIYVKYFEKIKVSEHVPFVLLDAFYKGDLSRDNWVHRLVIWVFLGGCMSVIKVMLSDPQIDPGEWSNLPLRMSLRIGDYEPVATLLEDPRVNPSFLFYDIVRYVRARQSRQSGTYLVEKAMNNPNFVRDYGDMRPLLFAVQQNDHELVRLLIQDPRIDLGGKDNSILRRAYAEVEQADFMDREESFDVFVELLKDPRTDPSDRNNDLFIRACKIGDLDTLKVLILDPRVDPMARQNEALCLTLQQSHLHQTFMWLLKEPRVNPGAFDNRVLICCLEQEHLPLELIRLLLDDERVDPSIPNNEVIRLAIEKEDIGLINRLMQDPRCSEHALVLLKHKL